MKRALLMAVVLFLMAPAVYMAAGRLMDRQKEDIVVTESTYYGDVQAAEGLCLEMQVIDERNNGHLSWDISYPLGSGKARIDFSFFGTGKTVPSTQTSRISMWNSSHWGLGKAGNGSDISFDPEDAPLPETVKAVAEMTGAGERRTETVRLADYYEYYPVDLTVESNASIIPKTSYGYKAHRVYYDDDIYSPLFFEGDYERTSDCLGYFTDFFHIPVSEEAFLSITIEKDEAGEICDCQIDFQMEPNIESFSAFGSEGVYHAWYFAPSGDRSPEDAVYEETMDMGDHYGICYYPYVKPPLGLGYYYRIYANLTIDPTQAKKVCDLEPGILLGDMIFGPGQDRLYLTTGEGGETYLRVYEAAGDELKLRQKLLIPSSEMPEGKEAAATNVHLLVQNEGVLMAWDDGSFAFALCEDGELVLWCPRQESVLSLSHQYAKNFWDFDGERLAIATLYWRAKYVNLAVYTKEGLQWHGICGQESDMYLDVSDVKWE